MQVLLLVLSILLLTIISGNRRVASEAGNNKVVKYKPTEKKATLAFPGDRLSVYSSRFDMIVN